MKPHCGHSEKSMIVDSHNKGSLIDDQHNEESCIVDSHNKDIHIVPSHSTGINIVLPRNMASISVWIQKAECMCFTTKRWIRCPGKDINKVCLFKCSLIFV